MDTAPFPENEKLILDLSASMLSHLTTTPFSCSGRVPIPASQPVQLRFKGCGESLLFPLPVESEEQHHLFDALLNSMTAASFGRGTEEVFDEKYRRALKLDFADFLTSFCPYEAGIVDVVRRMLVPGDGKGEARTIRAGLYKLNVYSGPGGMFKAHVDTPRSEEQVASLVVCLPVAHEGGQLAVRHAGRELLYDWSQSHGVSSKEEDEEMAEQSSTSSPSAIYWAAFYSDCTHEVLPVTSGHRVTLTYNLYARTRFQPNTTQQPSIQPPPKQPSQLDGTQLLFSRDLASALANERFLPKGHVLAISLTHAYAHTSKHLDLIPARLKGGDLYLYAACAALGLRTFFRPVIECDPDDGEGMHRPFKVVGTKFEHMNTPHVLNKRFPEDAVAVAWPGTVLDKCKVTWLAPVSRGSKWEAAFGYAVYGNEPGAAETMYSAAAMFVVVPPWAQRVGKKNGPEKLELYPLIRKDEKCVCPPGEFDSDDEIGW